MRWARWRGCVGGIILLFLMGCAGQPLTGFGLLQTANGGEYMVAGAPGEVALTLTDNLRRIGLSADISQQGEDIRIASKTRNGDKFALVLKRFSGPARDGSSSAETIHTKVRFEWENGPDEQTRTHALASLNVESTTVPSK